MVNQDSTVSQKCEMGACEQACSPAWKSIQILLLGYNYKSFAKLWGQET